MSFESNPREQAIKDAILNKGSGERQAEQARKSINEKMNELKNLNLETDFAKATKLREEIENIKENILGA